MCRRGERLTADTKHQRIFHLFYGRSLWRQRHKGYTPFIEHPVHYQPERIDIGGMPIGFTVENLRRHIVKGTDASAHSIVFCNFCNTKVTEFEISVF